MDSAALAAWTPVALNLAPGMPTLDWGNLGDTRLSEPFFDQTVERWAAGPAPRLVRTDLAALAAADRDGGADPDALVFHLSRCGSTLVSRLLAALPETRVIAEPASVNALLLAEDAELAGADRGELLRLLVRALGRWPGGGRRRFVLKTSSWNVTRLALFRRAFPNARLIFVLRSPGEVLASLLADPPGWMALRATPRRAARLFGLADDALAGLGAEAFCVRALRAILEAARGADALVVDYGELPEAIWSRIAPHIGLSPGTAEIAHLAEEARWSAKHRERRLFTGESAGRRAAAAALAPLAAELEPLYRALGPLSQSS